MSRWIPKLTLNQRLGLVALVLGALAVFANVTPGRTVTVNAKELLTDVARTEDHVAPAELAAWIVEGRADYRLVDIRDEKEFSEYHIPSAVSVPLATVLDGGLARTEKIVLYGNGGVHAAQAWMVLKGHGYTRVYTLLGGLEGWKDQVLFPVMPQNASADEQARFERAVHVARFFGGQPRAAAGPGREPMPLPTQATAPQVAPPTLPAGTTSGPRTRRQGC